MNKMMMSTMIAFCGVALSAYAAEAREPKESVEKVIQAFVKAGDAQDPEALNAILHDDFRVVFHVAGSEELTILDRATYAQLLGAKKIGGDSRKLKVLSVEKMGRLAEASVRLDGAKARFDGHITLVQTDGGWKLIQDATLFSPKSK